MKFLVAFAMLIGPATTGAQATVSSEEIAVQATHNFGRCVVDRSPRAAAELLALDYRTEQYADRISRLAQGHDHCLPGGRLGFQRVLFAGSLAEHLLKGEIRGRQLTNALTVVPNPPLQARDETEMMALCTVRTAPSEVAELLSQPVASPAEDRAMQAITPKLNACLAAGQALNVNRPGLRSVLALAAWRIAKSSAR